MESPAQEELFVIEKKGDLKDNSSFYYDIDHLLYFPLLLEHCSLLPRGS